MIEIIVIIALGIGAGVLAGLFGVGGGVLFVPALTIVVGLSQLTAEATSLLAIIPVAIYGSWRQTRAGTVRWTDALWIGAFGAASAIAGAYVADILPASTLRIAFAGLLVITAAQLAWRALRTPDQKGEPTAQR
jgi:uncharacterized membrane protein YfcA